MGKRGTRNKPESFHIAAGTYRKDRHAGSVQAPPGTPDMPEELSGEAAQCWDWLVVEMDKMPGVLATADRNAMAAYCVAWQRMIQAKAIIDSEGLLSETSQGVACVHPAVRVEQSAIAQLERLGSRFALTPSDRAGLKIGTKKEGVSRRARA